MKTLCFALILSQTAMENSAPPPHIQDLLKKRILYQMKQQNTESEIFFDDASCSVVAQYEYSDEAFKIFSSDKGIDMELPYSDILSGKKLELSSLSESIQTRANIVAATATHHDALTNHRSIEQTESSGSKKWLPWVVVGAVGLVLGGYVIYNSMERNAGDEPAPARRQR